MKSFSPSYEQVSFTNLATQEKKGEAIGGVDPNETLV
jgi:hypothetical protein